MRDEDYFRLNPNASENRPAAAYTPGDYTKYAEAQNPTPVPQFDIMAEIKKLQEAQAQAQIAGLSGAYASQVSNLNAEKATIAPQYYDKRNQANATMNNNARSFADFMASRGLSSSGVSAQGTMNNLNQYQGNLGSLNRQEQSANNDIARRMTDAGNAYASDVAAAQAGAQAQALQRMIDQYNADRTFNRSTYESDRSFDYQSNRDTTSDQRYENEWGYQQDRDQVADHRYVDETSYKRQMDAYDMEFQRKQAAIETAYRNRQLTEQQRQNALDEAYRNKQYNRNVLEADRTFKLQEQKANESKEPAQKEVLAQKELAIRKDLDTMPTRKAYDELFYNSQDYINELGIDGYNKLLTYYKNKDQGTYYNQE